MQIKNLSNKVLWQMYEPSEEGLPFLVVSFATNESGKIVKHSTKIFETLEEATEELQKINKFLNL